MRNIILALTQKDLPRARSFYIRTCDKAFLFLSFLQDLWDLTLLLLLVLWQECPLVLREVCLEESPLALPQAGRLLLVRTVHVAPVVEGRDLVLLLAITESATKLEVKCVFSVLTKAP